MNFNEIPTNFLNFDKIFERATRSLEVDGINEKDFLELYGAEQINSDVDIVNKLQNKFDNNDTEKEKVFKKLATIFEAIINEQSELSEWMGSKVMTMSASKYDDYINGVDSIAEINTDGSLAYMGLAIDATFSSDVNSKFKRIKKNIENGNLATVKYFKSQNNDFMGQLRQVPRVVIGADANTINELIELWTRGRIKELSEHPIQFQILDLIIRQLECFKDYAKEMKKDNLIKKFDSLIEIFVKILDERTSSVVDSGKRDEMFEIISDTLYNTLS